MILENLDISSRIYNEFNMLNKALTMAFPFRAKQYPQIRLEIVGTKIQLRSGEQIVRWEKNSNKFFNDIRMAGFFQ